MISSNTDAVQFEIDEDKFYLAEEVLNNWQKRYRLELERDDVVKLVMRDINNYCEIVETSKGQVVNFKGSCFAGCPNIIIHSDGKLETIYQESYKQNSMVIVAEAVLKKLLFEIPIEKTILNCNDIHLFAMISHLGSTYEKCVQESPNGDIELQRNNRIYAGFEPSGTIVKVKADGRRDSLANCPPNPIVDNANELTIDKINKKWYIEVAQQRVEDFLGTGKQILKGRKKLMKKDELIEENEKLKKQIEELENNSCECKCENDYVKLLKKINEFRKEVQAHEFILDKAMDSKLGGGEYSSIGQFYNFVQQTCIKLGLDFAFEPLTEVRFERDIFKPSVGATRHLSEVECVATFTDLDTGCSKMYRVLGSGSDSIDKSLNSAITLAFRKWFTLNFTPKEKFDWDEEDTPKEISESKEVKVPTYIPPQVKEEVKKEVVATPQHEDSDKADEEKIAEMIMEIREKKNDPDYGKEVVDMLQKGLLQTADIDAIKVKIENTYFDLGLGA